MYKVQTPPPPRAVRVVCEKKTRKVGEKLKAASRALFESHFLFCRET